MSKGQQRQPAMQRLPRAKLAFSAVAYSSFPVWVPSYPLDETIRRLAAIGYDGIEIVAAAPHAYPKHLPPNARSAIARELQENGIVVAAMLPAPGGGEGNNVSSPLIEERKATVANYREVIELCANWGGKSIIYVGGWRVFGTEQAQAWEWSVSALRLVAKAAAEYAITVAVEPTPADSNLIESCDDALLLMQNAGEPNVKVMFDTSHVMYRNEVITDYVYRMGAALHHVHVAEQDRGAPGSGSADFPGLLQALADVGFDGFISVEAGFSRRGVSPDEIAGAAYAYLRGVESALRTPKGAVSPVPRLGAS